MPNDFNVETITNWTKEHKNAFTCAYDIINNLDYIYRKTSNLKTYQKIHKIKMNLVMIIDKAIIFNLLFADIVTVYKFSPLEWHKDIKNLDKNQEIIEKEQFKNAIETLMI